MNENEGSVQSWHLVRKFCCLNEDDLMPFRTTELLQILWYLVFHGLQSYNTDIPRLLFANIQRFGRFVTLAVKIGAKNTRVMGIQNEIGSQFYGHKHMHKYPLHVAVQLTVNNGRSFLLSIPVIPCSVSFSEV